MILTKYSINIAGTDFLKNKLLECLLECSPPDIKISINTYNDKDTEIYVKNHYTDIYISISYNELSPYKLKSYYWAHRRFVDTFELNDTYNYIREYEEPLYDAIKQYETKYEHLIEANELGLI